MTVSADLEAMLRVELVETNATIEALRYRAAAINFILGEDADPSSETPKATFTADDARNHAERPVEVSGEAVRRPTRKARKGSRPSLRASLSTAELTMIRLSAAGGESYAALADEYKVSRSTIGNIVQKKGCYE